MLAPELLIHYTFFDFLTLDRLKAIAEISKQETYASGTVIFREKERAYGLYILVNGSVDLFFTVEVEYHPELHKELLFGVITPGDFFGISAVIAPYILTSSARASALSQVIKIDSAKLRALCDQDEQLAYGLMHQVAKATIERLNATRIQLAVAWSGARVEK